MMRIAIVEDEMGYRKTLREFAMRFSAETNTALEISEFVNGIQLTQNYKAVYDVIFLDIQLPLMDGLEAARRIRQCDQEVILIFVTNMAQYALRGYEVNAHDFVVKPIVYPAFEQKMKKVARILASRPSKYMMLPLGGSIMKIPTSDVYYIETANHRLYCHTVDGVRPMSSGTLTALENQLASEHFSRCNSCFLVNLRHVTSIDKDSVVVGDSILKISRPRKKAFLKELTAFIGGC